jgi:hypothetical protein
MPDAAMAAESASKKRSALISPSRLRMIDSVSSYVSDFFANGRLSTSRSATSALIPSCLTDRGETTGGLSSRGDCGFRRDFYATWTVCAVK